MGLRRALTVAAVALSVAVPAASAPAQSPNAGLLQTYLPVLVFHPDERWPPADPAAFVGASRLEERGATGGWSASSRASLPDSSVPCSRVPCFRLNLQPCVLRAGPACYRTLVGKLGSWAQPVVFGNVVDVRTTPADLRGLPEQPRTLVRYWLFYDVDDWSSTRPGGLWQLHEGDWESITVALGAGGAPLFVATSRHCRGAWRPWSRVPLAGGTHPRVFVALGSHAGYFAAGSQRNFPLACAKASGELARVIDLARRAGVRSADRTGSGRSAGPGYLIPPTTTLRLVDLGAGDRPAWARFAGVWSEGEILYLRTLGVTRTATYGEGPRTPAFDADVTGTILGSWTAE